MNSRQVEYVVIGGVAAIAYGVPRMTLDLDILIRPTRDNAERLLQAFMEAGLGTAALTSADDLLAQEITIFKDRVRVDVQTRTPGVTFDAAYARRNTVDVDGIAVPLVSRGDLIATKRAAGRPRDLEDVRILEGR
ncbi:MAG: nucleotidyltransferase [Planctomycetes bacterium]|nr:nucleotidyltransferase [Planctomycetota bacterium]